MTAEQLAQLFHETYERLAPQFGYKTREESAKPWADVPKPNKLLMTAVCAEVAAHVREAAQRAQQEIDIRTGGAMIDAFSKLRERAETAERKLAESESGLNQLLFALGCQLGGVKSALQVIEAKNAHIETADRKLAELDKALQQFRVHLAHMIQNYRCLAERSEPHERHGDEECTRAIAFLKEFESVEMAALASLRAESKEPVD